MKKEIQTIIFLDVFNTYFELISQRIMDAGPGNCKTIYVGDLVNYTITLCLNNGWSPVIGSRDEINEILQNVLCLCFQRNKINGIAEWSDDMQFVTVN